LSDVEPRAADGRGAAGAARWARLAVLALLLVAAALWLRARGAELVAGIEVAPRYLLPLVATEALLLVLRGLLTRTLCGLFEVRLGRVESARLSAWTSLANYVTPFVGGTGLRATYLKRFHQLPLTRFLSVQAATYTLHFMVSATVGLVCLALLPGAFTPLRRTVGVALAGVLLACLVLHHWPFGTPAGSGRIASTVRRVLEGWVRIRGARSWTLLAILVANAAAQAVAVGVSFAMLGLEAGAVALFFVASIYSFSILIAITPASLGVSEGAVAFAAKLAGLSAPTALAAAAARRVVALAVAALVAGVGQAFSRKPPETVR